jgi:protease-4
VRKGCGLAVFVIVLVFIVALVTVSLVWTFGKGVPTGRGVVALVTVEGIIATSSGASLFGGAFASSSEVSALLAEARDDDSVKAIVIRVNSPGGSVAASQEIYNAVNRVRREGKPVVISMGDVAASGGYYISAPADWIIANPGTITGSIGVILEIVNYGGLMDKLGVKAYTFKQGKFKDIGSPYRPPSDAEKEMFDAMGARAFQQFFKAVLDGRKGRVTEEQLEAIADGRPFLGDEALEYHLVDQLGDLKDAVDKAGELGSIPGKPTVRELGKKSVWDLLMEARLGIHDWRAGNPFPAVRFLLPDRLSFR